MAPTAVPQIQSSWVMIMMMMSWMVLLLVLPFLYPVFASQSIVEKLPGYSGALPFRLQTGYISVGEIDDVKLFYYFIESQRNPVKDPLVLWLSGGPGCSSLSALVYENGPLMFDFPSFNGSLPSLLQNPYSWTKFANIIYLDAPVGTGFSYSTTSQGYYSSDTKSAKDANCFLRKWLLDHPRFITNPFYIGGDSYSGKIVPMTVLEISNGNEAGQRPHISLQGYFIGNPVTDEQKDKNSAIPFAFRVGIISTQYYEAAKSYCNGEYVNPDQKNASCIKYLQLIDECTSKVNEVHILEPRCGAFSYGKPDELKWAQRLSINILKASQQRELWCREDNYVLSYVWANDPSVQQALRIQNGTKTEWNRCNETLSYEKDVASAVEYHRILSGKGYRALIYSGDHDMSIPYVGTLAWISSLNLTIDDYWRPWFVDGQVAGFTEVYEQRVLGLTFATVKGGGHTAPEYKPKQCFAMAERWFSYYDL